MAVQIETRGQLQEFMDILSRRSWQVILPAAFFITLGTAFAVIVPKKYTARTTVELRPVGMSVSAKDGRSAAPQITSRQRLKKVVQELKNTEYLALEPGNRGEFIESLAKNVKVTVTPGGDTSTFVAIQYADVNKDWVYEFLRALRDDWIQDVLERDRNKVQDESARLREEKTKLEKQYRAEEDALTELKTMHGISATQPIPGGGGVRGEDPAYDRLQSNKTQLEAIDLSVATLKAKIESMQKRYDEMPAKLTKDEIIAGSDNAKQVRDLDVELVKLHEALRGYRPEHPKYKTTLINIKKVEDQRDRLTRLVTKSELQTVAMPNRARDDLRDQIQAHKLELESEEGTRKELGERIVRDDQRVAELHPVYREVRERSEKIASLLLALQAVELRYQEKVQQSQLIASPLANPFELTEEVEKPNKPTEPNPWMIIVFSTVAGLAVGVGSVVVMEFSKNCFRSVSDISRVLAVPVLGNINTIVTQRELKLRSMRRLLVGVSSMLFISCVVFVTWAWSAQPELLSAGLRDTIEEVRAKLR